MVWSDSNIWLRNIAAPIRGVMRFKLVYHGSLSSSGNSGSKQPEIRSIREQLSRQLAVLWDTHDALQVLKEEAYVVPGQVLPGWEPVGGSIRVAGGSQTGKARAQFDQRMTFVAGELPVGSAKFIPLIRKSLSLACELEILFLRQQPPGDLITQGGDLDNRIKTLLDALRMPSLEEQQRTSAPAADSPIYCLMESDALVAALDVETDRLLFSKTTDDKEVYLVIGVSVRVLNVNRINVCLL